MDEYAVPIMPSRDLAETAAFYGLLGFETRGAPPEPWLEVGVRADPATGSRLVPPRDTDYGLREFALVDRSGNLLRIGGPIV